MPQALMLQMFLSKMACTRQSGTHCLHVQQTWLSMLKECISCRAVLTLMCICIFRQRQDIHQMTSLREAAQRCMAELQQSLILSLLQEARSLLKPLRKG
jgi:hypothetical protein